MKLSSLLIPILSVAFAATSFAGTTTSGKACTTCAPTAEDKTLGATATLGYDTNYIFRGVQFAENLISGSIDYPIVFNDKLTLGLNAWFGSSANDSAEPFAGGGSYEELDLAATLLAKLGPVTAGLKYTWYNYLGDAGDSLEDVNELGVTLATALAGFDLSGGAYYDWTAEGFYFEAAVSRTFKINEWLSLVPGVLISFGDHYYGVNGGNTIRPSLAAPIKLTKTATLTPYIAGNLPYGSLDDLGEQSRVYGGVALSVTF
jgi:hypothetical protein